MRATSADVGVIGGSGLYELPGLADVVTTRVHTPFGEPSDALVVGTFDGRRIAFLPRHGRGHRLAPADIPFRQNIYALRALGVRQVLSVSAVGSLREQYAPGHLLVPDQIADWTRAGRPASFFGPGLVVHAAMADPYCARLRGLIVEAAREVAEVPVHDGGTYVCIEGPQFSTRAESELFRALNMDVVGMTAVPEAKLAREAELCYAGLALVTDYDCWRSPAESVDASTVAAVMAENTALAHRTLAAVLKRLPADPECGCQDALRDAIITARHTVPQDVRSELHLLVGRYLDN